MFEQINCKILITDQSDANWLLDDQKDLINIDYLIKQAKEDGYSEDYKVNGSKYEGILIEYPNKCYRVLAGTIVQIEPDKTSRKLIDEDRKLEKLLIKSAEYYYPDLVASVYRDF